MAQGLISNMYLEDIGNAIRNKTGTVTNYYPSDMANAINNISGGGSVGPKTITSNGIYNSSDDSLDGYNSVNVAVTPNLGTLNIGYNGVYNAIDDGYDGYSSVNVQVSQSGGSPMVITRDLNDYVYPRETILSFFNSPVEITNNVTNCFQMFSTCTNFNQPVTIPDSVTNCAEMFSDMYGHGTAFNSPVIIGNNVTDCSGMFTWTNFNRDIRLPQNVINAERMFSECDDFSANVYIDGRPSISAMFERYPGVPPGTYNQVNVYCNDVEWIVAINDYNSIVGYAGINWTSITNGYYSSTTNIYLYNNYSPATGVIS